jgi:DNA-binding XRE family transcriptional regulator
MCSHCPLLQVQVVVRLSRRGPAFCSAHCHYVTSSILCVTVYSMSTDLSQGNNLSPEQCRMARAALSLGVRDLAVLAKVSPTTITRLERGEGAYPRTLAAIRTALEAAGVEFIAENGGGAGVRLRKG